MVEVRRLDPHDPLPEGRRNVVVMHRLDEDDPRHTHTEIVLTGTPGETVRPMHPDGKPMSLDEAIKAAQDVARSEGLHQIYVIDRTSGAREREVLSHGGDHTVNMASLSDDDVEEGERGSDMRDAIHTAGPLK